MLCKEHSVGWWYTVQVAGPTGQCASDLGLTLRWRLASIVVRSLHGIAPTLRWLCQVARLRSANTVPPSAIVLPEGFMPVLVYSVACCTTSVDEPTKYEDALVRESVVVGGY